MSGAIVVGASTDLGRAVGRALQAEHGSVGGISLTDDADEAVFAHHVVADVSTADGARRAIDALAERLGGVSALVTAAGRMPIARVEDTTAEQWEAAIAGTLSTAFHSIVAVVPHLTGPAPAIVAVSSINATRPAPGVAAYAAAKGGVEALVREAAVDLGVLGIRVNAVAPGLIGSHDLEGALAGYLLQRPILAEHVAEAVAFLASPQSAAITGAVLPVDGGLSVAAPSSFLRPDLRRRLSGVDR